MWESCYSGIRERTQPKRIVAIHIIATWPLTRSNSSIYCFEECTYFEHLAAIKTLIIKELKQKTATKAINQILIIPIFHVDELCLSDKAGIVISLFLILTAKCILVLINFILIYKICKINTAIYRKVVNTYLQSMAHPTVII